MPGLQDGFSKQQKHTHIHTLFFCSPTAPSSLHTAHSTDIKHSQLSDTKTQKLLNHQQVEMTEEWAKGKTREEIVKVCYLGTKEESVRWLKEDREKRVLRTHQLGKWYAFSGR